MATQVGPSPGPDQRNGRDDQDQAAPVVSETRGRWIVFLVAFVVTSVVGLGVLLLLRGTPAQWCEFTEFGFLNRIPAALALAAEVGLAVVLALGGVIYWAVQKRPPKLVFVGVAGLVAAVVLSFVIPDPDCRAYQDSLPGHRTGRVELNLVNRSGETATLTADAKCVLDDDIGETHIRADFAPMTSPSAGRGEVQVTLSGEIDRRVQSVDVRVTHPDHDAWALRVDDWKYGGAQLRSGWTRESGVIDITPNQQPVAHDWRGTVSWNCLP